MIRNVLIESEYTKTPDGSFTFSFPVQNDEEITITATYNPRRPFEVEC